jgi:3-oxoacyl-[acyl-carrier protein] reductase
MELVKWNRELAVNLTGAFNCIQAVIDGMAAKRWGRIVNISSGAAVMGGACQASYVASKAGLAGLTKTVALEHARDGITCNVIYPGLIKSAASDAIRPDMRERIARRIPVRRLGEPRDVANAVVFLASDRASYINGAELFVDAGMRLFTF